MKFSSIKAFLGGLKLPEFLSTPNEVHALIEGIADGYCPWQSRYEPTDKLVESIRKEHHYYSAGTVVGFATFIFSVAGAVSLVLGVIV